MHKYFKNDDYITILGFLMHNTVRIHRPKLSILVQEKSYKRVSFKVIVYITPSEITVRNHCPKSASEINDISTKIVI